MSKAQELAERLHKTTFSSDPLTFMEAAAMLRSQAAEIAALKDDVRHYKAGVPTAPRLVGDCITMLDWRHRAMYFESCWSMCSSDFNTVAGRQKAEIASLKADKAELVEALKLCVEGFEYTRQYIGYEKLPAIDGWSWYEADKAARAALTKHGEVK